MDMSLSLRDKKVLLMFFGILFFFLGFYFGYKPMTEEAQLLAQENASLQSRLDDLLAMAQNKEFYVKEIEDMQAKIEEYCSQFPTEVRPEDGIVLAWNMENTLGIEIPGMSFGEAQVIIAMDGSTGPEEGYDETPLAQQANAQTQAQINEIEGVQEESAYGEDEVYHGLSGVPVLYRNIDSFQFSCAYETLKDTILYLAEQTGRMTIDTISTSFDSATGKLTGGMTVNLFSMTGTDGVYNTPDAGDVNYGTDNIFGSIGDGKKRSSGKSDAKAKAKKDKEDNDNTETDEGAAGTDADGADAAGTDTNAGGADADADGADAAGTDTNAAGAATAGADTSTAEADAAGQGDDSGGG